ncbi:hypothetical protein QTG54_004302 [Skeletonema marinoi]|uniref:Glutaredoxin domain-containing protein n=1 Tax=Skeletonema marinoi TaxID=267567 RepID=A0AAD8YEG0_9STRA|nr:hypothetical protein QTG54_004302 [Skeletonema marinoi]
MISTQQFLCCCFVLLLHTSCAFQQLHQQPPSRRLHATRLHEMKRPILDRLATFVFKLENDRVDKASVIDDRGRNGEPMEWAEENSFANKFSTIVASNDIGYRFKQSVADLVAGDYDKHQQKNQSKTSSLQRRAIELDLLDGNKGNEIRAELGKITRRTSVPSIFIDGTYIGGAMMAIQGCSPSQEMQKDLIQC